MRIYTSNKLMLIKNLSTCIRSHLWRQQKNKFKLRNSKRSEYIGYFPYEF